MRILLIEQFSFSACFSAQILYICPIVWNTENWPIRQFVARTIPKQLKKEDAKVLQTTQSIIVVTSWGSTPLQQSSSSKCVCVCLVSADGGGLRSKAMANRECVDRSIENCRPSFSNLTAGAHYLIFRPTAATSTFLPQPSKPPLRPTT